MCPCATTLILCDSTPLDLAPRLTLTDTDPEPYFQPNPPDANVKLRALVSGQPFWNGDSVTIAPPPDGETSTGRGVHRYIAARITADVAGPLPCGAAGDVRLTVTGRACNQGPASGVLTSGRWRIVDGSTSPATEIVEPQVLRNVGASGTFPACRDLSLTATVPYDKLVSGDLAVVLDLETHDENGGKKTWTAEDFTLNATLPRRAGYGNQFLRTYLRDSNTGEVIRYIDNDLYGSPYYPSGDVAQCQSCTS